MKLKVQANRQHSNLWKKAVRAISSHLADNKGVALLLSLWILTLLTLIAAEFAYSMRMELKITTNFKQEMQAYYLAHSGINAALAEIMSVSDYVYLDSSGKLGFYRKTQDIDAGEEIANPPAPIREGIKLQSGYFSYLIEDEEAKIDLNWVSNPALINYLIELLKATGVENEDRLNTIRDSILDWRDDEAGFRLNGAEDEWYLTHYEEQGFSDPYKCKDGDFSTVEELLMVRGMTPEILFGSDYIQKSFPTKFNLLKSPQSDLETETKGSFSGIYQYLTVYNPTGKVNVNTASETVIKVLLKNNEDLVNKILESRSQKIMKIPPAQAFKVTSSTFRITATGYMDAGFPSRTIVAVVSNNLSRSFNKDKLNFRYWRDYAPPPEYQSNTNQNQNESL